jgi:hypothetical protein
MQFQQCAPECGPIRLRFLGAALKFPALVLRSPHLAGLSLNEALRFLGAGTDIK